MNITKLKQWQEMRESFLAYCKGKKARDSEKLFYKLKYYLFLIIGSTLKKDNIKYVEVDGSPIVNYLITILPAVIIRNIMLLDHLVVGAIIIKSVEV